MQNARAGHYMTSVSPWICSHSVLKFLFYVASPVRPPQSHLQTCLFSLPSAYCSHVYSLTYPVPLLFFSLSKLSIEVQYTHTLKCRIISMTDEFLQVNNSCNHNLIQELGHYQHPSSSPYPPRDPNPLPKCNSTLSSIITLEARFTCGWALYISLITYEYVIFLCLASFAQIMTVRSTTLGVAIIHSFLLMCNILFYRYDTIYTSMLPLYSFQFWQLWIV